MRIVKIKEVRSKGILVKRQVLRSLRGEKTWFLDK